MEADNVQILENRVLGFDRDNIRVQVSGGKFYEVDAFVAYRISDPRVFRAAVSGSVTLAEQRLRTRLDAALRRVYGLRGFESALSEERASMMREVRDQLRPDATLLGLEIADVRIRRTDLTQEVSQQTFDRMKADWRARLEAEFEAGQAYRPNKADWLEGVWSGIEIASGDDRRGLRYCRGRVGAVQSVGGRYRPEAGPGHPGADSLADGPAACHHRGARRRQNPPGRDGHRTGRHREGGEDGHPASSGSGSSAV